LRQDPTKPLRCKRLQRRERSQILAVSYRNVTFTDYVRRSRRTLPCSVAHTAITSYAGESD